MTSVEIHIPISLNQNFAVMCHVLAKSIATRAALPDGYRIIFTVSRDTGEDFSTSLFNWKSYYPVEFRWVEQETFDDFGYAGTALQRHLWPINADVLLFMDADILVAGPLTEIINTVQAIDGIVGRTAWGPPKTDIGSALARRGIAAPRNDLIYAGYGVDFLSPRDCPPYFNFGIIAMTASVAATMRETLPSDFEAIQGFSKDFFTPQIALCSSILRSGHRYGVLDSRFNLGNGDLPPFQFQGNKDAERAYGRITSSLKDPRLLHYCVASPGFTKAVDMNGMDRVQAFCLKNGLGQGNELLQRSLSKLLRQHGHELEREREITH